MTVGTLWTLGRWVAILGWIGAVGAVGCSSAAVCTEECFSGPPLSATRDAGTSTSADDAGSFLSNDDASAIDSPLSTGSTPPNSCDTCLYGECIGAYANCVGNASC